MVRIGSLALVALLLLGIAGCVKVTTGQTEETAESQANLQAKQVKGDWYKKLSTASAAEKAKYMQDLADSVIASYLRYGDQVVSQWRQGSGGRGQAVSDAEMQTMVQRWTKPQAAIFRAYEDNLEYGLDLVVQAGREGLEPEIVTAVRDVVSNYYTVYSGVFYPAGTIEEYQANLETLRARSGQLSRELRSALGKYFPSDY